MTNAANIANTPTKISHRNDTEKANPKKPADNATADTGAATRASHLNDADNRVESRRTCSSKDKIVQTPA
jgi:hypothetical protein